MHFWSYWCFLITVKLKSRCLFIVFLLLNFGDISVNLWLKIWVWVRSEPLYTASSPIIRKLYFLALKKLGRGVHNNKILMVHQNLVCVTSFCDLKSPSLKLVTPSLNYTPNAVLKSRDSKLVTLICTPLKKKKLFSHIER